MAKKKLTPASAENSKNPAAGETASKPADKADTEGDETDPEDEEEGDDTVDPKKKKEDDGEDENAATKERVRIDAILSSPEAKGRQGLAQHLALKTSMSATDAVEALKASPEAQAGNPLSTGMRNVRQPAVGANGDPAAQGNALIDNMTKRFAKK